MTPEISGDSAMFYLIAAIFALAVAVVYVVLLRGRRKSETPALRETQPERTHEAQVISEAAVQTRPHSDPAITLADASFGAASASVPRDDVPPDLAARKQVSIALDESVAPHTLEEIQRREPKPLFGALSNTRESFFGRLKRAFGGREKLEAGEIEELEEILYTSDLGPGTVQRLLGAIEGRVNTSGGTGFEAVRMALKDEMMDIFAALPNGAGADAQLGNGAGNGRDHGGLTLVGDTAVHHGSESYLEGLEHLNVWDHKPAILMIVGVNGAGKTTTIGKLARKFAQSGRKVLVAAGDTFRAAAESQLKVWTERAAVEIFAPPNVTDPSAVAFAAVQKAQASGVDIVIIDTAGRLHTQKNLMEELKKMKRVIQKLVPESPHETLLVLDANSGQNALIQAREFHQALGVSGVVLTKLDGTAKGGVAVGVACELKLPIKLIGVGEGIEDLRRFSAREFVDSIL